MGSFIFLWTQEQHVIRRNTHKSNPTCNGRRWRSARRKFSSSPKPSERTNEARSLRRSPLRRLGSHRSPIRWSSIFKEPGKVRFFVPATPEVKISKVKDVKKKKKFVLLISIASYCVLFNIVHSGNMWIFVDFKRIFRSDFFFFFLRGQNCLFRR